MRKLHLLAAVLVFSANLPAMAAPVKTVASFSIIGDMVKNIGGNAVDMSVLVEAGEDVHTYQPSPDDMKTVKYAELVFYNGLGFEGWIDRLIEASGTKGEIIVVSEGVAPLHGAHEHGHKLERKEGGNTDPHAWQNPKNACKYAENIAQAIAKAAPEKAEEIRKRADEYISQILDADEKIKKSFTQIPKEKRKIITSHDAFGYFGDAYGIQFLAPMGISTDAQPSAKQIAKLVAQIKKEKTNTIFIENLSDPRIMEQIAKDTGAKMGGILYSDSLSSPDGEAPAYVKMLLSNARKMKEAMDAGKTN